MTSTPTHDAVSAAVAAAYDARAATYDESARHREPAAEVAASCALDDRSADSAGAAS
ncbi:hypothetical protein [Isoptericola sp. NPDC057653]|uniref:hypothetical protein n=1 Tax=Isoptericola sp. NPDC057653 TaxID=3346195 RepID=UPI00369A2F33